jgi:hypothetical protein
VKKPIKKPAPPPPKKPIKKPPPQTIQKKSPPAPPRRRPIVSEAGNGVVQDPRWRLTQDTNANNVYEQPVSVAATGSYDNFSSIPLPAQAPLQSTPGILMEVTVVDLADNGIASLIEDSL